MFKHFIFRKLNKARGEVYFNARGRGRCAHCAAPRSSEGSEGVPLLSDEEVPAVLRDDAHVGVGVLHRVSVLGDRPHLRESGLLHRLGGDRVDGVVEPAWEDGVDAVAQRLLLSEEVPDPGAIAAVEHHRPVERGGVREPVQAHEASLGALLARCRVAEDLDPPILRLWGRLGRRLGGLGAVCGLEGREIARLQHLMCSLLFYNKTFFGNFNFGIF